MTWLACMLFGALGGVIGVVLFVAAVLGTIVLVDRSTDRFSS